MSGGSAAARRTARLAAVQALYQMEISGASTADVIADFSAGKLPRESETGYSESEGDGDLFKALVEKAVDRQATLDRAIARHLGKGWRLERLDAVARAILRAGAWELLRQVGMAATQRVTQGRVSWIEGGHLFPFEKPAQASAEVLRWLREFQQGYETRPAA